MSSEMKQRADEMRRQMQVSLRAGRIEEYMQLLAQLETLLHPKNHSSQSGASRSE